MCWINLAITLALVLMPTHQHLNKPGEPADLVVTSSSWKKFNLAVGGDRDPFAPNDMVRAQREVARETAVANSRRARDGDALVKTPMLQIHTSSLSDLTPGMAAFRYTAKVRNAGRKTVISLVWAYVVADPESLEEVGRNYFRSTARIRPGKSVELVGYSNTPPSKVLNVKAQTAQLAMKQTILFYQIKYSDGSTWERSSEASQ